MNKWLQPTIPSPVQDPEGGGASPSQDMNWVAEWYYLKAGQPVGAFTYPQMVQQLQRKQILFTTSVWRQGMKDWTVVLATPELHPKTIKKIREEWSKTIPQTFVERKHLRTSYCAQFVLHNQKQIWRAISIEIGAGGLGVIADTTDIEVGTELFVHKVSIGFGPSINAMARVVTKSQHGLRPGQSRYGLEFTDIAADSQREIMDFTDSLC